MIKYLAKRNFKANGKSFGVGQELTADDLVLIANVMENLAVNGCLDGVEVQDPEPVSVEEELPLEGEDKPKKKKKKKDADDECLTSQ